MVTKVKLRRKNISNGRQSLYLDFYPPIPHPTTGKTTRREFLNMYIFEKPKNQIDKKHNHETLMIGEGIRQKRENFLNKPEIYDEYEKEQLKRKELGELCFVEYFRKLAEKRKTSNQQNWKATLNYLEAFTKGKLRFADLNERFLDDFKEYLLTTNSQRSDKKKLSQNSAVSYFNKVKAALKQAYRDDILQTDLNSNIKSIKEVETRREFLTLEELNRLAKTPCNNPLLKVVALFSVLTGMGFKDIQNLLWSDISLTQEKEYLVLTKRQKTQRDNYLPISEQAYGMTSGAENPLEMPQDQKVFDGLKYSAYQNKNLSQWIKSAGINRNITFHSFRHTFATLQLANGTDLYTISKMLGHKNIKTTQIYAKIVDETKREAANKIKIDL